jgi:hypothetical protein
LCVNRHLKLKEESSIKPIQGILNRLSIKQFSRH